MIDRMDIDALLIGALYGELTPADEARLTAHLESHPADRTALADLTHTRAAVRESRILSVQLEPPQAVSALLLQEAARRAPRPARETAGWFHRFTRSFMMHPAMAAAAMLVLVVGVAGTFYVRHGDQFAESPAPAVVAEQGHLEAYLQVKPAPATATATAETGRAGDNKDSDGKDSDSAGAGVLGNAGSAAGSDTYRVGLEEATASPKVAKLERAATQDEAQAPADRERKEAEGAKGGGASERFTPPAKPEVAFAKPAKQSAPAGIELRSPEPAPKDFDDEPADKADKKVSRKDSAKRGLAGDGDAIGVTATANGRQGPGAASAGGGAATAVPGMMPSANHAAAPAPAADPAAGASPSVETVAKPKAPAKTASRSALAQGAAPSVQPPPPAAAPAAAGPSSAQRDSRRLADKPVGSSAGEKSEDKPADDKALADWAQKQREQVLALVKSNNCREAANAAVAIYNRAPEFYAANIATDRSIKPCIAYVNDVRERADRSRAAAKRANAADTPAQAAPPTRK